MTAFEVLHAGRVYPDGAPAEDIDALRRDAARYRWLRDVALYLKGGVTGGVCVHEFIAPIAYGPDIDAAIDAAMGVLEQGASA